jgi:hypothetical protein
MNNVTTSAPVSEAVIKGEILEPNSLSRELTNKEVINALIKQATYAEDYYRKLMSQFEENLRKKYLNL